MRIPSGSGIAGFVLVFLASLQGLDGRFAKNDEGRIRDYLLSHGNYSSRERPVLDSQEAVSVSINLMPYAMIDLNERNQLITVSAWLSMLWTDPRLTWNETEFGGEDMIKVYVDEVWTPRIFITNVLDLDSITLVNAERGSIIVRSNGQISLGTPMVVSTQCPMLVEYFPFDVQGCPFWFSPENEHASRLRLVTDESPEIPDIASREWDLINLTSNWFTTGGFGGNISFGVFCMTFQRNPLHYIWTLVVPSTCLCLMSFTTFMSPPDCGERIALAISTVLGLTVFQLQVADILPADSRVYPHLTTYLSMNFMLACITVPLSLVNINLACGDSRVTGLGRPAVRRILLELLPRLFWIPTYSERVKGHDQDRVGPPDEETGEEGEHEAQNNKIEPRMTIPRTESQIAETGSKRLKDGMSRAEKTKMERRIVASVMDTVCVIVFAIAFVSISIAAVANLRQETGLLPDHECIKYMDSNYYREI